MTYYYFRLWQVLTLTVWTNSLSNTWPRKALKGFLDIFFRLPNRAASVGAMSRKSLLESLT